jgi:adenine deaminase
MTETLTKLLAVARGDQPADLLFKNARVVNVFSGEILVTDVAIYGGSIAAVGDYNRAAEVIDLNGRYLAPALINGHTHIESSMLDISQYARAVVVRGTLSVITDLHELANVCGLDGLRYVMDSTHQLPLDVFLLAPSCVPATNLETSGAEINLEDIKEVLKWPEAIGLGEVMNFPDVINSDKTMLAKLEAAKGTIIDGHAPGVSGHLLNAYIAAGIGSDHEMVTLEEGREKLRQGMRLMIREGSSEKNLEVLLPLVTDNTYKRCLFVVDDRSCTDLLRDGDIDAVVRKAIALGLEPVRAIQLATINSAEYFHLDRLGAIAPGYFANLIIINDLDDFKVDMVFYHGKMVAKEGYALFGTDNTTVNPPDSTVNMKPFGKGELLLKADSNTWPVIEVISGQIITHKFDQEVKILDGNILVDVGHDVLKLVVVERHHASGNIGLGLIKGFGLKRGALASSIAHDSHNIIAVGCNDDDIFNAINEVARMNGGLAVAAEGKIMGFLALPIAGLMSSESLDEVVTRFDELVLLAQKLGTTLPSPFATLSFMALPVIPELRLTDLGLVDAINLKLVG